MAIVEIQTPNGIQYQDEYGNVFNAGGGLERQGRGGNMGNSLNQVAILAAQREIKRKQDEAEAKRVADLRAQGLNPDGSPIRPEYNSLLDPATGMLKKEYVMEMGTLDPSKLEGFQAFKEQALRKGPSAWAELMKQQQELQRMSGMEKAANQAMTSAATARSGLAMRGGMSSGARERIAMDASRNLLNSRQQIGRLNTEQLLKIGTQDEDNRLKFLGQLPGMETDIEKYNIGNTAKVKEFNIMRALEEKNKKDTQDLDVYKEQQKKWAAERQAQATERSGGGGGK